MHEVLNGKVAVISGASVAHQLSSTASVNKLRVAQPSARSRPSAATAQAPDGPLTLSSIRAYVGAQGRTG